MGSTGAGTGRGAAGGGATATSNIPFPQGAFTGKRSTQRGRRALGGGAAISAEEFQRATGVNPRTGRRKRSR